MSNEKRFIYFGYCPTQKAEKSIKVITRKEPRMSNVSSGYKKDRFHCDYAADHLCEIENDCPIYLDAPHNPHFA